MFGTICYFLISTFYYTNQQKYIVLLQIGVVTILIPIAFFYFLSSFDKADDVMIPDLSERKIPLIFQGMILYLLLSNTIKESILPELYFYLLGGLISTFLLLILLFLKIKASIHMVGISTLTIFVIALSLNYHSNAIYTIAFLIAMNGIVASSRLELQAHTNKELLIGFFSGMLPQLILTYFWL